MGSGDEDTGIPWCTCSGYTNSFDLKMCSKPNSTQKRCFVKGKNFKVAWLTTLSLDPQSYPRSRIRVGFGFRGCRIRVSGFGFRLSEVKLTCRFRVSGLGFRLSEVKLTSRFRVSGFASRNQLSRPLSGSCLTLNRFNRSVQYGPKLAPVLDEEQLAVAAAAIKHDASSLTAQQLAITAWAFGRLERNDSQVVPASKIL